MRIAFTMQLKAGFEHEYEKRHNPIWPELQETLLEHGVQSYSIFLDNTTNTLFAYVEIDDEERWNAIASTEICRKWWDHMAPLMEVNSDNSPDSAPLREIFHIDHN